jgi:BirA family biotin operon repressor/biotin-[acetyl-CoA-carboxylase] ligase
LPEASEWTVLTAKKQTKGRGKPGSLWFSPEGGLYFSLILKPRKNPEDLAPFTLMAAEAIVSVIKRECYLTADIKLPNDILIDSKKVCGILTEKVKDALIVGIGLNLNIKEFTEELNATSLLLECKKNLDLKYFLFEIIDELKKKYLNLLHNRL